VHHNKDLDKPVLALAHHNNFTNMGLDPLTLGGLAVAAAGTGLGLDASVETKNAMNKTAQNELNRQQGYAAQGRKVFNTSLSQSTPQAVQQQMAQGAMNAAQQYKALQQNQPPGLGQATGTTQQNPFLAATQNSLTQGQLQNTNAANAQLQGYGASDVAQAIKDLQARTQLGQIGQFAQSSENVLPLEMQQAQQSHAWESGLGSLLGTVGGLTSLYGALNPAATGTGFAGALGGDTSMQAPFLAGYQAVPNYFGSPISTNLFGGLGYQP
jgi:hypothetical protein